MNQILKLAAKYTIPSEKAQKLKDAIVEQTIKLVQKEATKIGRAHV